MAEGCILTRRAAEAEGRESGGRWPKGGRRWQHAAAEGAEGDRRERRRRAELRRLRGTGLVGAGSVPRELGPGSQQTWRHPWCQRKRKEDENEQY